MNADNNIFHYATSELSQDAFLCWLLSFALRDADDEAALKSCAVDFLKEFVPEIKNETDIWLSEPPKKQYKSVDILLTVNDRYKVIIEDKTDTSEHDNQLKRYLDTVKNDFPDFEVKGVYYKTGFQSDISDVVNAGYTYLRLESILNILERHLSEATNYIFFSYYSYLKQVKDEIDKYNSLAICQWKWAQINGFYDSISRNDFCGMQSNYGYVSNPSGGFYGMWFYNDTYLNYNGAKYELYLQCEFADGELKICYKVAGQSGCKCGKEEREFFTRNAYQYGFTKPNRQGRGRCVTLGLYTKYELKSISGKELKEILSYAIQSYKQLICNLKKQSMLVVSR